MKKKKIKVQNCGKNDVKEINTINVTFLFA